MSVSSVAAAPNISLLEKAYETFKTIPRKNVMMDSVMEELDVIGNHCGTIACGMGWLGVTPAFNDLGLEYKSFGGMHWKDRRIDFMSAAQRLFKIDGETASYLFGGMDEPGKTVRFKDEYKRRTLINHKNELLKRCETVLAYYKERA